MVSSMVCGASPPTLTPCLPLSSCAMAGKSRSLPEPHLQNEDDDSAPHGAAVNKCERCKKKKTNLGIRFTKAGMHFLYVN